MIGRGAFQETDFFGMTLPVVKHSYLVWDINDIPRIIKEAFTLPRADARVRCSSTSQEYTDADSPADFPQKRVTAWL
jgi:hypothetical protein